MHDKSIEKTAFISHHGLYEFKVAKGLSLIAEADDFAAIYVFDYAIVFSQSLDSLGALEKGNCLRNFNLKLNPKKCKFMCEEVE